MAGITIFTIGFIGTSAEHFFGRLESAGVRILVDVRLNRTGQLSGFARHPNLAWFLRRICAIDYAHEPRLAPDKALLGDWRARRIVWDGPGGYAARYRDLLGARGVPAALDPNAFDGAALLCSEATAATCHRRLAAEAMATAWGPGVAVHHL